MEILKHTLNYTDRYQKKRVESVKEYKFKSIRYIHVCFFFLICYGDRY